MRYIITALLLSVSAAASFSALAEESKKTASAVFAGGCFWCMESPFDAMDGVLSTTSGYSGGKTKNPTYQQVSGGNTGHLEVLEVEYDPSIVTYKELLKTFWVNVDLLDGGGQFCDRGYHYTSAIFYGSDTERRAAQDSMTELVESGRFDQPIQTQLLPATQFYAAEKYHQDYYLRNPVRYKFYRWNCGRDQRLNELWGEQAKH